MYTKGTQRDRQTDGQVSSVNIEPQWRRTPAYRGWMMSVPREDICLLLAKSVHGGGDSPLDTLAHHMGL